MLVLNTFAYLVSLEKALVSFADFLAQILDILIKFQSNYDDKSMYTAHYNCQAFGLVRIASIFKRIHGTACCHVLIFDKLETF